MTWFPFALSMLYHSFNLFPDNYHRFNMGCYRSMVWEQTSSGVTEYQRRNNWSAIIWWYGFGSVWRNGPPCQRTRTRCKELRTLVTNDNSRKKRIEDYFHHLLLPSVWERSPFLVFATTEIHVWSSRLNTKWHWMSLPIVWACIWDY